MPKIHDISLPTSLKDRLAMGHPWVYRTHVPPVRLPPGTWVRLRCGNWQGYGLWDDDGQIAVRIFAARQPPDAAWMRAQVQNAWDLRAPLRQRQTTAYRWLFGEGDGIPGVTVDLYGAYAVAQVYMDGADDLLGWLVPALRAANPALRGVLLRGRPAADSDDDPDAPRAAGGRRATVLWGAAPPANLVVEEHGLRFEVDMQTGQKTGLFLDHRENRRYVQEISAGRTVLNCFAYTGAFSLYALRGGARHVVSNDIGKGLAASADANLALNDIDPSWHSFVTADSFEVLNQYARDGRRFDLVVLDPPSFAKSKQNRYAAIRAYTKLNALALRCVEPGGLLASASCTSQVGPEPFKDMLAAAGAQANRRLQIIHEAGQPLDHPVPPAFPEGRYLKFVVLRAL